MVPSDSFELLLIRLPQTSAISSTGMVIIVYQLQRAEEADQGRCCYGQNWEGSRPCW
jgi:hypothetical protein